MMSIQKIISIFKKNRKENGKMDYPSQNPEQPNQFHKFLELPKDLINLFMYKYFYPCDALTCSRVCKLLNSMVPAESLKDLKINVIKQIAYEKQMAAIGDKRPCELCNQFVSMKIMKRHVAKHKVRGTVPIVRKPMMLKCNLCEAPYPQRSPHSRERCPMKIIKCNQYFVTQYHLPWAQLTCDKHVGYRAEMQNHSCIYRCKICSRIFKSVGAVPEDDDFYGHLRSHTPHEVANFLNDNHKNDQ